MQSAWLPCLGRHAIRFWCNRNQMSLERLFEETMVYRQIVCLTLICNWFSRGSIPTKVEYFSNSLVVVVRTQPSNVKYFRNDPRMNFLIKISTLSGKSWTTNWVKQIGIWKVPPLPKNSVCVLWRNRHRHRLMGVFQFFVRPLDRGTLRCCSRQQCGRGAFEAQKAAMQRSGHLLLSIIAV